MVGWPWINEGVWRVIAYIGSRPRVAAWLIERAKRTPYFHLPSYMDRWWLFNRHDQPRSWWRKLLPSIRVHHILREDQGCDPHNHPWEFRSIVLRGWYIEERDGHVASRSKGSTYRMGADAFHHISVVPEGGAVTLFIAWKYRHAWGFKTAEGFVPWKEYKG